jgi:hypothetical protein
MLGDNCKRLVLIDDQMLARPPVVVSLSLERPFDGGNEIIQANLTFTYYFERYHHLPARSKP